MAAQFYLSLLNPMIAMASSVLLALLWHRWPSRSYFFPLSVAFLYLGLGFITQESPLFAQPGAINYAGNVFFYAAVMLVCVSALVRVQAGVPVLTFSIISALTIAGFLYFAWVHPSTTARIVLMSVSFTALIGVTLTGLLAAGIRTLADRLFLGGVTLGIAISIGRPVLLFTGHLGLHGDGSVNNSSYWESIAGVTPFVAIIVVSAFVYALVLDIVDGLQREADHDHLTGLLNRRGFETAVHIALERSGRGQALLIADIDDFKQINDRFGHDTGDRVIKSVGDVLRRRGAADFAGRIGGEEFALFYRDAMRTDLEQLARDIRDALAQDRSAGLPEHHKLTISIGLHRREAAETLEDMLGRADRALYSAKAAGKNRAVQSAARLKSA